MQSVMGGERGRMDLIVALGDGHIVKRWYLAKGTDLKGTDASGGLI
jgi:hypothetical protein